ncbi:MAG: MBL fold metallo-hydrolase [Conexivisphaerales archaeon]
MQLNDNIYRIDGTNGNVYVIIAGENIIQVDSGMKGQFGKIRDFYDKMKVRPSIVIITHSHMDHIGALAEVHDRFSPRIYAHKKEIPVIRGERGMYAKSATIRLVGMVLKAKPVKEVADIAEINMEGIETVETPGHTPGSITVVYTRDNEKYAFVGDAAFEENGGLHINERFSLDVETAKKSLEKIIAMKPVTVLPGHGNPIKL